MSDAGGSRRWRTPSISATMRSANAVGRRRATRNQTAGRDRYSHRQSPHSALHRREHRHAGSLRAQHARPAAERSDNPGALRGDQFVAARARLPARSGVRIAPRGDRMRAERSPFGRARARSDGADGRSAAPESTGVAQSERGVEVAQAMKHRQAVARRTARTMPRSTERQCAARLPRARRRARVTLRAIGHRRDGGNAHLDRLLDHVVHALGAGQALQQRDVQGDFALDRVVRAARWPRPSAYRSARVARRTLRLRH